MFLLRGGVYTSIDFPGSAAFTEVWKMNDYGEIAGRYWSSAPEEGSFKLHSTGPQFHFGTSLKRRFVIASCRLG